jgi:hypothetical protein
VCLLPQVVSEWDVTSRHGICCMYWNKMGLVFNIDRNRQDLSLSYKCLSPPKANANHTSPSFHFRNSQYADNYRQPFSRLSTPKFSSLSSFGNAYANISLSSADHSCWCLSTDDALHGPNKLFDSLAIPCAKIDGLKTFGRVQPCRSI